MASAQSACREVERCRRASDPERRLSLQSGSRVLQWIRRNDERRWSRLRRKALSDGSRTHFTLTLPMIKRSEARNRVHICAVGEISNAIAEKKFSMIDRSTGNTPIVHRFSTTLDALSTLAYAG